MKVSDSTSAVSQLHAAQRAQDTRKAYGQNETLPARANDTGADKSALGKNAPASGNNLPPGAAPAQKSEPTESTRGLANAIEQLQRNSEKNPQASGLLRALESLTERQGVAVEVDTEA